MQSNRSFRQAVAAVGLLVALLVVAHQTLGQTRDAEIPDRTVTDVQGQQLNFRRDIIQHGPVLVSFIFTRCRKSCPLIARRLDTFTDDLARLPEAERPRIVLISIDPEYDSPDRLRQWAASFRNGSKWTLLTGHSADLRAIALALTGGIPSPGEHSPTLYFIDVKRAVRRTIYGLAPTHELLAEITRGEPANSTSPAVSAAAPISTDPASIGAWTHIPDWSVVAVHTVLLPSGRVLFWPRYNASGDFIPTGREGSKTPQAWIWDPTKPVGATGRFINIPNSNTNLFCSGHALMPDGRVLIIGGHDSNAGVRGDLGVVDVNQFDPTTQRWSQVADMNVERWYPTLIPLANGAMMVIGGSYSGVHVDGTPNQPVELWQPGGWSGFQELVGATSNLA